MAESDEQFLARFGEEIEPAVRGMGTVTALRIEQDVNGGQVRIVIALDGRLGPIELVLAGDSLLDAAAGWPARIGEARLALAFREIVAGPA
jgi:hypothetical protein